MTTHFPMHVWLVEADDGQPVAFASDSLYEYVPDCELLPVPGATAPIAQVMEWLQELVPVVRRHSLASQPTRVLLVHTTPSTGTALLGVCVTSPPLRLAIDDSGMDGFKLADCGAWQAAAISGFVHQGRSVPLIDPDGFCK